MRRTTPPRPPRGLLRLLLRLPIHLYRWRLGWLLGQRFVLINHVGRRSGRHRQVVVEVVSRSAQRASWTVASGFGADADWYRNLRRTPDATIVAGRHAVAVTAVPLTPDEGAQAMAAYAAAHPRAARRLARFMGFEVDGSARDYREVGRAVPFLRLARRPG